MGNQLNLVLGSLALGYATKQGWLARLPLLGTLGPITSAGLLGWAADEWLDVDIPPLLREAITSALVISAFNVGQTARDPGGPRLVGDVVGDEFHPAVFFE